MGFQPYFKAKEIAENFNVGTEQGIRHTLVDAKVEALWIARLCSHLPEISRRHRGKLVYEALRVVKKYPRFERDKIVRFVGNFRQTFFYASFATSAILYFRRSCKLTSRKLYLKRDFASRCIFPPV